MHAITGDFYYNSTTGQFKTVNDGGAPIGTWASTKTKYEQRLTKVRVELKQTTLVGVYFRTSYKGVNTVEIADLNTSIDHLGGLELKQQL